jgi:transposase
MDNTIQTDIKKVEILPLIKYYMQELGLEKLLNKYIPNTHKADIAPAQVLCILTMNIMVSPSPLYRIEDWLHEYLDGIAEPHVAAAKYNDDRIGRDLERLFEADRASLMAELSAQAIRVHQLTTDTIHNDTTSVTFKGAYEEESDPKAAKITYGYNKEAVNQSTLPLLTR